jgi:ribonuclease Z
LKPKVFIITFLGTAAASINPFTPTSSFLVESGNTKIMIDAGIGALRQLHRLHIDFDEINPVLLTHWHFDHYAGLRALLKSRKNTSLLSIYGPKPSVLARIYLAGLLNSPNVKFEIITGDFSKDCGDIHVEPVVAAHDIISFGWVLTERAAEKQCRKRRIVISGDTRPVQAIINAAEGTDLLVHEATYLNKQADKALTHEHSTVTEAANLAKNAGAGALALTHISRRHSNVSALREAEKIFPGVLVPSPLDKIYIEPLPNSAKRETFGRG